MKHKHAELVAEYSKDMLENDEPWLLWEYKNGYHNHWKPCDCGMMAFFKNIEYRRKPRTININGFEVPKPIKEIPDKHQGYIYIPYFAGKESISDFGYDALLACNSRLPVLLARGICHLTVEAAIRHSEALLSFTKGGDQ